MCTKFLATAAQGNYLATIAAYISAPCWCRSGLLLTRRERLRIIGRRLLLAWRHPSSKLPRCRTRISFCQLRNCHETK